MEGYVRFIVRHRRAVVLVVLGITALLASQLRYIRIEVRERAIFPTEHPYVQLHNRIIDTFGGDDILVIGVIPKSGDVFNPRTLEKIARLTRAVEQLPDFFPDSVLSIAAERVKSIKGTADGMDVQALMPAVPHDAVAIAELRQRALSDKLWSGTLVASDGRAAAIVAAFKTTVTYRHMVDEAESVVAPERDAQTDIILGGGCVVGAGADKYTATICFLFPIAVLVIALVHFEAFRTLQAMFLPLVTALISVVWAVGIMGALRQPIDTWSAATPVVILAVAAGHAVQILKRYYEEYARLGNSCEAVVRSVTAVGPTMLTAGLIASAGFASLTTFGVPSVRVLGLLLAFGILSALIIEMTFTPACRAMLPAPRGREVMREKEGRILKAALELIAKLAVKRPRAVLLTAAVVIVAFGVGAFSVRVDNSLHELFPRRSRLRRDAEFLDKYLAGSSTITLLIEGKKDGDIEEPEVLRAVSDLEAFLRQRPGVGATMSIADYVKEMHRAMHADDPDAYKIPDSKSLIAQYLLVYSMSGPNDFVSIVDPGYRQAILRGYLKRDEAQFCQTLVSDLKTYVAKRFAGLPATVHFAAGSIGIQTAMNESIVRQKILNVLQVSTIIFLLSMLALRSLTGGVLVLMPLVVAVVVNLGVMGWSHTWLSLATASITSVAISIGADFAIYLIFRIREELTRADSLETALHTSMLTSGKAIFFVSSAVVLGYLVLTISSFRPWLHLGALTALMIGVSALATVTVVPALIITTRPRFLTAALAAPDLDSADVFEAKRAAGGRR
jgi:predicted RND superfamily exporter protein